MRHKAIHSLKVHPSIKFVVDFALSKMSQKMKKRMSLYKDVAAVKKIVPADNLPIEYGGNLPMQSIIEDFKRELENYRDIVKLNDQMCVNLELYPQNVRNGSVRSLNSTINELTECKQKSRFFEEIQGSFKKLDID